MKRISFTLTLLVQIVVLVPVPLILSVPVPVPVPVPFLTLVPVSSLRAPYSVVGQECLRPGPILQEHVE